MCYNDDLHVWSVPNPDTITTLTVARTFIHGHPMSLNKGDPPGTILSDLLSPIFYSVGYYLGFRSTNAMIVWVYIMVFFISILAFTFVYLFFKRELPEVALLQPLFNKFWIYIFVFLGGTCLYRLIAALSYLQCACITSKTGGTLYLCFAFILLLLETRQRKIVEGDCPGDYIFYSICSL